MADSNFIVTRVLIAIYPSLLIRDDAIQPLFKKLLEYPEFDGFTTFSPPRPFLDNNATLGTLNSSSGSLKVELSRSNLLVSWTNAARSATFALIPGDVVDFVTRLYKTMNCDITGMVMFNEFVVKADAKTNRECP